MISESYQRVSLIITEFEKDDVIMTSTPTPTEDKNNGIPLLPVEDLIPD